MNYPIRHSNHILENLSKRFLINQIPADWVLNEFHVDYGTDFNCEIAREGFVIGTNFTLQLKAKEKEALPDFVTIKIKRSTINRWLNRLEPTMLVAFVKNETKHICIFYPS